MRMRVVSIVSHKDEKEFKEIRIPKFEHGISYFA